MESEYSKLSTQELVMLYIEKLDAVIPMFNGMNEKEMRDALIKSLETGKEMDFPDAPKNALI